MLDGLTRVIKVPVGNPLAGVKAVRSVPVDVMLDFGQWSRLEALFSMAGKAGCTIGFRTAEQHRHYGYDFSVGHSAEAHELENYRRLVSVLGVKAKHLPFLRAPQNGQSAEGDYVVCHLWPGGRRKELKQWSMEGWLKLIEELAGSGFQISLTGAAADRVGNDAVIERLGPSARRCSTNKAGLSLEQTTAVLARARLVVSVDTGVMHIAAALGVPLVALHGPTSSKRWGPLSERAVAIDTPLPDGGYLSLGWEDRFPVPDCMEAIDFERVRDACHSLLRVGWKPASLVQEGPVELAKRVEI